MISNQRGLFLDFDGTLANTVPMLRKTYFNFMDCYNRAGSDEEFVALMGPPLSEIAAFLKEKHTLEPPVDELVQRYRELLRDDYTQSAPMDGAPNVLKRVHEAGWQIAVVTSSIERNVHEWLAHNELKPFVSVVIGSESVARGKPDPEPYQKALERCGCEPANGVALEDTPMGAASAVAAGLRTFVIGPEPVDAEGWPKVQGFVSSFDQMAENILDV